MRRLLAKGAAALAIVAGSQARTETLADAIVLAYRTNPTIQSGRYDLRATDEGVAQARSELRPTAEFDVTGTYNRTVEGHNELGGAFDSNSNQSQIVIDQPLYTGGRATADRAAAEALARAGRETLRGTEGDLLLSVVTAYVDVRRYAAALLVLRASTDELEKLNREIGARQIAGELTRTDIALAQSQLDIAREEIVTVEEQLEDARADYTALVGQAPGDLAEEPPLPRLPRDVDDAYAAAERENPDLAQARYAELASREGIAAALSRGRPTLGLRGSAGLDGRAIPYRLGDQEQAYSVGVVFTLPLTAGGLIASQIREARDHNSSDQFKIETARRGLVRDVTGAWNQMVTAEHSATLLDLQRRAAATQLDGMISEYRLGLRSTFDVLYAQQSLRDAEVALLGSRRDRYVAEAILLRRTGLLEADTILTSAPVYDPAANLRGAERKNALPWDGVVEMIDRLGAPAAHRRPLTEPKLASGTPAFVPAVVDPARGAVLARSGPVVPNAAPGARSDALGGAR